MRAVTPPLCTETGTGSGNPMPLTVKGAQSMVKVTTS